MAVNGKYISRKWLWEGGEICTARWLELQNNLGSGMKKGEIWFESWNEGQVKYLLYILNLTHE